MLWQPKARTEPGELAKPLRDLLLDLVANPRYLDEFHSARLFRSIPASFLREYALGTVKRNFAIEDATNSLYGTLQLPIDFSPEYEPTALDWDYEGSGEERTVRVTRGIDSLHRIWEIKPEKYLVKEVKRIQDTN